MPQLMTPPPYSTVEPVAEILHGVSVTDPYRWLEDQDSPRTRAWIEEQTQYARTYLDRIPGRERIRARIREFLAVETCDSLQRVGNRYFFRKRLPDQEQPCIYMREGANGDENRGNAAEHDEARAHPLRALLAPLALEPRVGDDEEREAAMPEHV